VYSASWLGFYGHAYSSSLSHSLGSDGVDVSQRANEYDVLYLELFSFW